MILSIIFVTAISLLMLLAYRPKPVGEQHPPHKHDFEGLPLGRPGTLKASILFHYEEEETKLAKLLFDAHKFLGEYTITLTDPREGRELNEAIEQVLIERGFGEFEPSAIVTLNFPLEDEEPQKLSRAAKMDADLLERVDCVETIIARLEWLVEHKPRVAKEFLKGRSVERVIQDLKESETADLESSMKRELNKLFHHPGSLR